MLDATTVREGRSVRANCEAIVENQDDDKTAWTIKSVPVATRKLAVACAIKRDVTMGEWLVPAVRNQANLEAGELVIPPPNPTQSLPSPSGSVTTDLSSLAELMRAAQALAEAAGVSVPKATARHALALTSAQLRQARGLPPKRIRQTDRENGQTIDGDGPESSRPIMVADDTKESA
jgi:hypothetical protein